MLWTTTVILKQQYVWILPVALIAFHVQVLYIYIIFLLNSDHIMYVHIMYIEFNECDNAVDNNCNTETTMCVDTACGFDCIPCPGIYIIFLQKIKQ